MSQGKLLLCFMSFWPTKGIIGMLYFQIVGETYTTFRRQISKLKENVKLNILFSWKCVYTCSRFFKWQGLSDHKKINKSAMEQSLFPAHVENLTFYSTLIIIRK